MSGLVKQAWMACTIAFVILLPYIVLKRRLWFPGFITMTYSTFGNAKLPLPIIGFVRVQLLVIIASVLTVGFILLERKQRPSVKRSHSDFSDQAPIFLLFLLILMLVRMLAEYADTRASFLPYEITDLVMWTLIPCLIVIIHPGHKYASREILRGIALGALLALLPAFFSFESLSNVWTEIILGDSLSFQNLYYRDRNTLSRWGAQAAISISCLSVLLKRDKGKNYLYIPTVCLVVFTLILQSRRWFLNLSFFFLMYFLFRPFFMEEFSKRNKSYLKRKSSLIQRGIATLSIISLVYFIQARFERLGISSLLMELGPSYLVGATSSRFDIWKAALETFSNYPWFGVGLSGFGVVGIAVESGTGNVVARHIGAHSFVVQLLVAYGIIGGFCAIVFLLLMIRLIANWLKPGCDFRDRRELTLLVIYWVSLFPGAMFGGGTPHKPGMLALLPCVMYMLVKSRTSVPQDGPRYIRDGTWGGVEE